MGIGKIFFGAVIIIIGITIWFMLSTPQGALNQVLFSTPAERYSFSQTFTQFQFLYFIIVFAAGIGMVVWGTQS